MKGEMEEQKERKARMRKQILKERNSLSEEVRHRMDKQIFEELIRYDEKEPCAAYLSYVNYKSEVSTKEFILWCLEKGKTVFVPKVFVDPSFHPGNISCSFKEAEKKRTEMDFFQIHGWEELETGYQGILEPKISPGRTFGEWLAKSEKEAGESAEKIYLRMLLPGAVFDKKGNRIGYGGGFYDRWLAGWEHLADGKPVVLEKIGLAYEIQVVETLPAECFDKKVDRVITE